MNHSEEIAKLLLEIKAITLNLQKPYRHTSGILAPIYCDNRLIISHPPQRNKVIAAFINLIETQNLPADVIAGTATAAIPHAAWIADRLNKPMVYVRNQPKAHGKQNQVEGLIHSGQSALIIEDLINSGGSAIATAQALRAQGAIVTDCVAIFSYQRPIASQQFTEAHIRLYTLTDLTTFLNVAVTQKYINENEKAAVLEWRDNPQGWATKLRCE